MMLCICSRIFGKCMEMVRYHSSCEVMDLTWSAAHSVSPMLTRYMQVATILPLSNIFDSCFIGPIRKRVLQAKKLASTLHTPFEQRPVSLRRASN